jgi:HEPN domain-containing protein
MDDAKSELVKTWLIKARNDLGSANRLANGSETYYDTAIYHCQQAAEKALKAFLVHHDIEFEKIHNLNVLVDLCIEIDSEFNDYLDAAAILTPYATSYRYPNELFELEPEETQIEEALKLAEQIFNFVMKRLPEDVRPPGQIEIQFKNNTQPSASQGKNSDKKNDNKDE